MKQKLITMIALVTVIMAGCRKDPVNNLSADESRIYITNYDSSVNFSNYQTFSITDSVVVVNNSGVGAQLSAADRAFITAVTNKMQQLGYTLVNKSQQPDLGVSVSRIIRTSTGVINYNDYWGLYSGFYDPFFWGFPGYGFGAPGWGFATYQVREGMLSIDIVDLKNAESNNNQIRAVWNGMIRGSGIFNENTAASQVDLLFNQSSYLGR